MQILHYSCCTRCNRSPQMNLASTVMLIAALCQTQQQLGQQRMLGWDSRAFAKQTLKDLLESIVYCLSFQLRLQQICSANFMAANTCQLQSKQSSLLAWNFMIALSKIITTYYGSDKNMLVCTNIHNHTTIKRWRRQSQSWSLTRTTVQIEFQGWVWPFGWHHDQLDHDAYIIQR